MPIERLGAAPTEEQDLLGPVWYDMQRGMAEAKASGDKEYQKRLDTLYKETLDKARKQRDTEKRAPAPVESQIHQVLSLMISDLFGVARK